jgi:hypothetical protein
MTFTFTYNGRPYTVTNEQELLRLWFQLTQVAA